MKSRQLSKQQRSQNQTPINLNKSTCPSDYLQKKSHSTSKSQYHQSAYQQEQKQYLSKMVSKFKPNIFWYHQPHFINSRKQIIQIRDMDTHFQFIVKHKDSIFQKELCIEESKALFISFERNIQKMIEAIDIKSNKIVINQPFVSPKLPPIKVEYFLKEFKNHKIYQNNKLITPNVSNPLIFINDTTDEQIQ